MTVNRDTNRVTLGNFEKFVLAVAVTLAGSGVVGTVGMWRELGEVTQRIAAVERSLERLESTAITRR